jgi:hypothetical protein
VRARGLCRNEFAPNRVPRATTDPRRRATRSCFTKLGEELDGRSRRTIARRDPCGIGNSGSLLLRNDQVSDNTGSAHGNSGSAQGGGIWNSILFGAEPQLLALDHTTVAHTASAHGLVAAAAAAAAAA